MSGPLTGYRIIEVAGIGPGPFGAMMLADMGADVIRVDRAQNVRDEMPDTPSWDVLNRGRRSIGIDLKNPDGVEALLKLVESADAIIEGFRPGVMERLGVGPDVCLARNPKLVFGRMTGWGQDGPYAPWAGHDINYIALAGALGPLRSARREPDAAAEPGRRLRRRRHAPGLRRGVRPARSPAQRPGAGHRCRHGRRRGRPDDDVPRLPRRGHVRRGPPRHQPARHRRALLRRLRCADGKYISVGSIEPQFYAELLRHTGLQDDPEFASQMDKALWPVLKGRLEVIFHQKTRDEWCAIMEHTDVCFAPVLTMSEAVAHPAQPGPRHLRRGRRDRAAGARAPVQPLDGRRSSGRRPTPGSTPVRCSPTGASRPPRSTSCSRPAP